MAAAGFRVIGFEIRYEWRTLIRLLSFRFSSLHLMLLRADVKERDEEPFNRCIFIKGANSRADSITGGLGRNANFFRHYDTFKIR